MIKSRAASFFQKPSAHFELDSSHQRVYLIIQGPFHESELRPLDFEARRLAKTLNYSLFVNLNGADLDFSLTTWVMWFKSSFCAAPSLQEKVFTIYQFNNQFPYLEHLRLAWTPLRIPVTLVAGETCPYLYCEPEPLLKANRFFNSKLVPLVSKKSP